MKPLLFIAAFAAVFLSGCTPKPKLIDRNAIIRQEVTIQQERNGLFMNSRLRNPETLGLTKKLITSTARGDNPNGLRIELNPDYNKFSPPKKTAFQKQIAALWFAAVRANRIRNTKAEVEFRDSTGKLVGTIKEP